MSGRKNKEMKRAAKEIFHNMKEADRSDSYLQHKITGTIMHNHKSIEGIYGNIKSLYAAHKAK